MYLLLSASRVIQLFWQMIIKISKCSLSVFHLISIQASNKKTQIVVLQGSAPQGSAPQTSVCSESPKDLIKMQIPI